MAEDREIGAADVIRFGAAAGRITATSGLWLRWAEVAVEHERRAFEARERLLEEARRRESVSTDLADETRAAMVAVSAAAHSLDALYGMFVTPEIRASFGEKTPRQDKIRICLQSRFRIGRYSRTWPVEFDWLDNLRDAAVHASGEFRDLAPHPSGVVGNVDHAVAAYTYEAASRALDLLADVLTVCAERPREGDAALANWSASAQTEVRRLLTSR